MPLSLRRGTVSAIVEREEGLVRCEVDGLPCLAYPRLTGPVALGDEVLVNVQARELGLGSGGFDILYANLTRGLELPPEPGAHVMKLPYTPLQAAVRHAEEDGPLAESLAGMPVVCCSLHSQLAPVCAGIGAGVRVAYVQLPGGALPVSLSDAVRALKERGLARDGGRGRRVRRRRRRVRERRLGARLGRRRRVRGGRVRDRARDRRDRLVARPRRRRRGGGGERRERARRAARARGALLGRRPARASSAASLITRAPRSRSVPGRAAVAWPDGLEAPAWLEPREQVDVTGWEEACAGLPLSHMGRGPAEDPWFFAAAFAAGRLARARARVPPPAIMPARRHYWKGH